MRANLVLLLPQEFLAEYFSKKQDAILEKLCKCGIEITSLNIVYDETQLLKKIDYYFSDCTVFVSHNIISNLLLDAINRKYATNAKQQNFGFVWANVQRFCFLLNLDNINASLIDEKFVTNLIYPNTEKQTFRTFGLEKQTIIKFLNKFNNYSDIQYTVYTNFLDSQIHFFVKKSFLQSREYKIFLRDINEIMEGYIYSCEDVSLHDVLADILVVRNKQLVLCDCLTKGEIVDEFCKNQQISSFVSKKILINEKNDYQNLIGISFSYLSSGNLKTSEMAYEVCAKLCEKNQSQVVLCLFGTLTEPYIAVGDSDEIHVFKAKHLLNQKCSTKVIGFDCFFKLIKKLNKKLLSFYEK